MTPIDREPNEWIRDTLNTPWKAVNEIKRMIWRPFIWYYFALRGVTCGSQWRIYGLPLIQRFRGSTITIGDNFEMRNWFDSNPLGVFHPCILATWSADAEIEIGNVVGMSGTTVCAQTRIYIGDHVNIGANTTIADLDFHPLAGRTNGKTVSLGASSAIIIEGDNFIGMHTIILKGSHIGRGTVIGAGSLIAGEIPPRVVVAGNPARVIREL
jgi:acetyltransferase-like isoleucine patch superfamily enzyme